MGCLWHTACFYMSPYVIRDVSHVSCDAECDSQCAISINKPVMPVVLTSLIHHPTEGVR